MKHSGAGAHASLQAEWLVWCWHSGLGITGAAEKVSGCCFPATDFSLRRCRRRSRRTA